MQEMSYDVTAVLLAETFLAFDNMAYVITCHIRTLNTPRTGSTVRTGA